MLAKMKAESRKLLYHFLVLFDLYYVLNTQILIKLYPKSMYFFFTFIPTKTNQTKIKVCITILTYHRRTKIGVQCSSP